MAFRCGRKEVRTKLEFSDVALTSYAGLELFGRYLRGTRFNATVRQAFAGAPSWSDFGVVVMVRLMIGEVGQASGVAEGRGKDSAVR